MKHILVGNAWVYANGSLHIGHLAGLLPGDVIARYHRAVGDTVSFVTGSDCHGTPVALCARQEGRTPQEISDEFHREFVTCFEKLGFSFDCYTKTSAEHHKKFVQEFHKRLYESPYVYEKETPQAYCENCDTFLADRFVTGKCPSCGADTRGDQCDECGIVLETKELLHPVCVTCGRPVVFRKTKHLYIAISELEKELALLVNEHPEWRKNAISFTKRYMDEGLRDRALTRDLEWGIEVPKPGYENKSIYIWAENVLGYLSASIRVAQERGEDWRELWNGEARHYYVHGKDNIPFHTIILPALLIANGDGWHLPDEIISSEYLTIEGRKISTSQNYAIWVKDIIDRYHPDAIRYYFLANGPEKKDADFSWREFVNSNNGELLGTYGNFVNRSLVFIQKYLGGTVPEGEKDLEIWERIHDLYPAVGNLIERGECKEALKSIFEFARYGNKYFDIGQPWITKDTNRSECERTLFNCVQMIANLAVLLYPFLPFSSEKVCGWLELRSNWEPQFVESGTVLPEIEILFARIDKAVIAEEVKKLQVPEK